MGSDSTEHRDETVQKINTGSIYRESLPLQILPGQWLSSSEAQEHRRMKSLMVLILLFLPATVYGREPTLEDLYLKFNLRTIYSSFGPRLKYFCESYPADYFPESAMKMLPDESTIHLVYGDDVWTIRLTNPDKIVIANSIVSGTWNSFTEYEIHFDELNSDWRANGTFIEASQDCVNYPCE